MFVFFLSSFSLQGGICQAAVTEEMLAIVCQQPGNHGGMPNRKHLNQSLQNIYIHQFLFQTEAPFKVNGHNLETKNS